MINLLQLSKLIIFTIFFLVFSFNTTYSEEAADIWKKKENKETQNNQIIEEEVGLESPIISSDENSEQKTVNEVELFDQGQDIIGLFDPEENNFHLNMWETSNGNDIKKIFKRINKLKISEFSEDLLFRVLFTNSYSPKNNLNSSEFLKLKVNWLIKNRRVEDLESLLLTNSKVGKEEKAIQFLINERLSNSEIKSACEKVNAIDKNLKNDYLEKFKIYCLINSERKEEAQLLFELLKERGFEDNFFEDKINYLLGINEKTSQKIIDNNLFNFYLSQITTNNFDYQPDEKTDKYIWRYLSSSNLIEIKDLENEEIILTYEKAAAENSIQSDKIFSIYKQIVFNVNQLINALDVYKNLPNYKARALIYQSMLLSDNIEKKLYLVFLLKDLFEKDKLINVYSKELTKILRNIDPKKIPENYEEAVKLNIKGNLQDNKKIKFNNDIIHRSKIIKHFLKDDNSNSKVEKDFKSVYKKIKRNKKYFISIMDIIVLESLLEDGVNLPKDLTFDEISAELTIPQNLQNLVNENQLGLVMLKIIEIIGEDQISDLDPETLYFLSKILNQLKLKKIRNKMLSKVLPVRA